MTHIFAAGQSNRSHLGNGSIQTIRCAMCNLMGDQYSRIAPSEVSRSPNVFCRFAVGSSLVVGREALETRPPSMKEEARGRFLRLGISFLVSLIEDKDLMVFKTRGLLMLAAATPPVLASDSSAMFVAGGLLAAIPG